jgi:hypothetical protein
MLYFLCTTCDPRGSQDVRTGNPVPEKGQANKSFNFVLIFTEFSISTSRHEISPAGLRSRVQYIDILTNLVNDFKINLKYQAIVFVVQNFIIGVVIPSKY